METTIFHKNKTLNATVIQTPEQNEDWVLFISGGNISHGKIRYFDWQSKLADIHINSVSFDYSGVAGSDDRLIYSSLESRTEEVLAVLRWIKSISKTSRITLFTSSMGGYIGLGAVNTAPDLVEKIVMYAPAAYSTQAHDLKFDKSFTNEIRKPNSWKTSRSFDWLKKTKKPVLILTPDNDQVIPKPITERYITIGKKNPFFTHTKISNCPHNCWVDKEKYQKQKDVIFRGLLQIINN